jgi:uncharacterized protein
MKNSTEILLVSDGFFHPSWAARRVVRGALTAVHGTRFRDARSLNALPGLDVSRFDALVLYYHHKQITTDALALFAQFVQDGGGVLAVHSATASFKQQRRYFEVLGGRFTGHGPVEPIIVTPVQAADPIFDGAAPFTIKDELYLHELWPDLQVHFTALHKGKPQPLVWTRTVGNGRVCYVGPGHRAATMRQPEVQTILQKGLKWVLEG